MSFDKLGRYTHEFNRLAGKDTLVTQKDFTKDFGTLLSEVQELQAGIETNNVKEIVDGVIDTIVVALGMWQKLRNLGVDMDEAASRIAVNNLSKFPVVSKDDNSVEEKTVQAYHLKGIQVDTSCHDMTPYKRLVFKNKETDKVLKPFGFTPVNIDDCIPYDLSEEGLF